jgi:putative NADPH-quinone reductase
MKRILLLLGHPDTRSFCGGLADMYEAGARSAGMEIRRLNLGELAFDPILRRGFKGEQALEPDLVRAQEAIAWCTHWVLVYPTWWGSFPALLKGFFDRVLLPGFAFNYRPNSSRWDRFLGGRSGRLFITSDAPAIWTSLVYRGAPAQVVKKAVLDFCGVRPVKTTWFHGLRRSSDRRRAAWLKEARRMGEAGA